MMKSWVVYFDTQEGRFFITDTNGYFVSNDPFNATNFDTRQEARNYKAGKAPSLRVGRVEISARFIE